MGGEELSFQFADCENQGILAWKTASSEVRVCEELCVGSKTPKGGHQRVTCGELAGWPPTPRLRLRPPLWAHGQTVFPSLSHMWPQVEFSQMENE